MNQAVLSLLVSNNFGVLTKVAGLFARRGYNIKSLSVGETEDPRFSRITIVTEADEMKLEQIYRQVNKLEDVRASTLLPPDSIVQRDLVLIKVKPHADSAGELAAIEKDFDARLTKVANGCTIIEATGPAGRVEALIEQARSLRIVEMSRTGVTALARDGGALRPPFFKENR